MACGTKTLAVLDLQPTTETEFPSLSEAVLLDLQPAWGTEFLLLSEAAVQRIALILRTRVHNQEEMLPQSRCCEGQAYLGEITASP